MGSEVDLVLQSSEGLRALEIKWKSRKTVGRAFRTAYGVDVETIGPHDPFVTNLLESAHSSS
jgi:hypothetical protein